MPISHLGITSTGCTVEEGFESLDARRLLDCSLLSSRQICGRLLFPLAGTLIAPRGCYCGGGIGVVDLNVEDVDGANDSGDGRLALVLRAQEAVQMHCTVAARRGALKD